PTTVPWRLYIDPAHRPPALAQFEFFHPTFLYESLWNLAVFALLVGFLRRPMERSPGALFLAYLGLYSVGRFFIEALRIDSLMLGPLRAAQVVSVLLVALSAGGILYLLRAGRPAPRSP
ncbi:MAG: prolipoprotein diacylglyceryl transferase family protein, partial [Candidatus Methylomirabilales bacterium]